MKTNDTTWRKLAQTARHAPDPRDTSAPFGFAGRVVARAQSAPAMTVSPWDVLSLKSLALALLVMIVSVGWSFSSVAEQFTGESLAPTDLMAMLAQE
jgi:hypothetical protein